MGLKGERAMPRRPRVFVEGAVYHVYNRLARGADIFQRAEEAEDFLDLLESARRRDDFVVFAWCLMANHYHLAVRSGPVPLARTMASVQARFGQQHNRRWRSAGPLWQSRYKAKPVETERHLLQLIAYIHLNPVTAGVVRDPARYPFSGHRELLGKDPPRLVDVPGVLALFGDTRGAAAKGYLGALKGERREPWLGESPGRLPWWHREPDRPLESVATVPRPNVPESGHGLERPTLTALEFLQRCCRQLEIHPATLRAAGKGPALSRNRYLVAALAVERWGVSTKALAGSLGRRADVVTRWVRLGAELRQVDHTFRARYERLDTDLANRAQPSSREVHIA